MIRIYKDKDVKLVTSGAYETYYKSLGYKEIIDTNKKEVSKETVLFVNEDKELPVQKEKNSRSSKRVSSQKKNKKED